MNEQMPLPLPVSKHDDPVERRRRDLEKTRDDFNLRDLVWRWVPNQHVKPYLETWMRQGWTPPIGERHHWAIKASEVVREYRKEERKPC